MIGNFIDYLNDHFVVFDGAMGTMLQQLKPNNVDRCPEILSIEDPEIISYIHKAYKEAGSDVIETDTFGANELKLAKWGLTGRAPDINAAAVKLAKEVMGDGGLVALSVGPTGHLMQPFGDISFDDAYDVFKEQIEAGAAAGADMVCIETMSDINEARAAILAAKESVGLPIAATMTFETNGRTLMGNSPASVALILSAAGADVVGVNCSGGVETAYKAIEEMIPYSRVPLMAQPNAGMPREEGGKTVYPIGPEEMLTWMRRFADIGVAVLGGCCGTTPAHIELIAREFKGKLRKPHSTLLKRAISSNSNAVELDKLKNLRFVKVSSNDGASEVMEAAYELPDAIVLDFEPWSGNVKDVYNLIITITSMCRTPLIFKNAADDVLSALLKYYGGVAGVMGPANAALITKYGAVKME